MAKYIEKESRDLDTAYGLQSMLLVNATGRRSAHTRWYRAGLMAFKGFTYHGRYEEGNTSP